MDDDAGAVGDGHHAGEVDADFVVLNGGVGGQSGRVDAVGGKRRRVESGDEVAVGGVGAADRVGREPWKLGHVQDDLLGRGRDSTDPRHAPRAT